MVELVSALRRGKSTMTTIWNSMQLSDHDTRLLYSMLNEVVNGFDASEYSDFFKYNEYDCNSVFEKLKNGIRSNRKVAYSDIESNEWVAIIETFRAVMFDFFEYNEFHTRLGYTFEECVDLFSRIAVVAVCRGDVEK